MNALTVNATSWHTKVYLWWYRHKFAHDIATGDRPAIPFHVNLCPYVRVVLLWSWLRWLMVDGKVSKLRMPWIIWGGLVGTVFAYLSGFLMPIDWAFLFAIAILFLIRAILIDMKDNGQLTERNPKPTAPPTKFVTLIKKYSTSVHDRVCPFIEIR